MYDNVFNMSKIPATFSEVIDQQVKFTKDLIDANAAIMKAVFDTFQPKKA